MKLTSENKRALRYCLAVGITIFSFVFGVVVGQHGRDSQRRAEKYWSTRIHPSQVVERTSVCRYAHL